LNLPAFLSDVEASFQESPVINGCVEHPYGDTGKRGRRCARLEFDAEVLRVASTCKHDEAASFPLAGPYFGEPAGSPPAAEAPNEEHEPEQEGEAWQAAT
jgi:hypothetical protein